MHHGISITGLTWPSAPTISMQPTNSATAKSEPISGGFRCLVLSLWPKHHVIVLYHPSGTYIKYVVSPEISYWVHRTLSTNYRHTASETVIYILRGNFGRICILVLRRPKMTKVKTFCLAITSFREFQTDCARKIRWFSFNFYDPVRFYTFLFYCTRNYTYLNA